MNGSRITGVSQDMLDYINGGTQRDLSPTYKICYVHSVNKY